MQGERTRSAIQRCPGASASAPRKVPAGLRILGIAWAGLQQRQTASRAEKPALLDVPGDTDPADIALELVGGGAGGGEGEVPTGNTVVHELGAHAEMLERLVFDAPSNGDAIIQAARLIEPLGGGQVDHAAVPRRQGYAATAINHDVVEDPAKPGAHAVDPVDVHLAGDAARIAADAEAPLDR